MTQQFDAIFEAQVEPDVATLVDEVGNRIAGVVTAGAESAHTPSPDRIGATGIETLLEGNHGRVAIGNTDAEAGMEGDGVAVVESVDEAEVDVALDILGILGVENLVGTAMLVLTDDFGDGIEEVAGRLDGGSEVEMSGLKMRGANRSSDSGRRLVR